MKKSVFNYTVLLSVVCMVTTVIGLNQQWDPSKKTPWNENEEPLEVVTPGENCGDKPSDAISLFEGKDLSKWESVKGGDAGWKVENGYMEVVKDTGAIRTKDKFGSCQLHVEFATPEKVVGNSQGRGNSGIFLMGKYELQVLDNYENPTYKIGYVGAVYGQSPPGVGKEVNVSRKPGQWQTYDILFHAPKFDENGNVIQPARVTTMLNGVFVQEYFPIQGATVWRKTASYQPHPDKLPLELQDHGNPTRFRNIWIRPLED